MAGHGCVIPKLVISRLPKVGDLQTQWVSLMERLKRKTKHEFKEPVRLCVSDSVTSPIRITDRLNHSESVIDLHSLSQNTNALFWLFVVYIS